MSKILSNILIFVLLVVPPLIIFGILVALTVQDTGGEAKLQNVTPICPDAIYSANGEGITYYINNTTGHMVEAIDSVGMGFIRCKIDANGEYVRLMDE